MDVTPQQLAEHIVQAYKALPGDRRLLVAIAGPPGSGKSTLAYPLTDALNAHLLSHPPDNPSHLSAPKDELMAEGSSLQGAGDEVAVCVGLDGWHHSRKELEGFDDPVEAIWRRGAAFTFNLPSYLSFLQQLRLPLQPNPPKGIPYPTFSHELKDPQPSLTPITAQHRIIVVEGLYTLLDRPGWSECASMFDVRVWVDVDPQIARARLVKRNFEAGIVDTVEECEIRVDAVDMVNAEEVRTHRVKPTYVIPSIDGQPFSSTSFAPS